MNEKAIKMLEELQVTISTINVSEDYIQNQIDDVIKLLSE